MATQLRLVDPPASEKRAKKRGKARATTPPASRKRAARASIGAPTGRAVRWGEWQLDARTRRIGREGIAAAREALEHAPATEPLPRAS